MSITNAMSQVLTYLNVQDTVDSEYVDGDRYVGSDSQGVVITLTKTTVDINGGSSVDVKNLPVNVQNHINIMASLITRSSPQDAACVYCGSIECTGAPVCQL